MELKCPVCQKTITVDAGSDAFYCKRCNRAYATARCRYQQLDTDKKFFIRDDVLYSYRGNETQVVIPSDITRIGAGCFADNQTIEAVKLSASVSVIEAHAFANCRNLVSVELPDDLNYICMGAFADCVKLPQVRVPKDTYVDYSAFIRCSALKASIYSSDSIKSAAYIGLAPEQISFRTSSSGGCYITTAVCERRGAADDCVMLTRFRQFRDEWLAHQPGGEADIQEYYRTAPEIVQAINAAENSDRVLDEIYQTYLKPCFDLLTVGNYQECRALYTKMVKDCEKKYLVN